MNKIKSRILVTEKGIEWQRELSQEHYLIQPKYLLIRRTVEIQNNNTQRTQQLNSKRRKPVNSILEYLPKYCEMQGFVESVSELNKSCDLKGINETLRSRKERLKFVILIRYDRIQNKYIDRNGLRLKIITIIDYNIQQHNFEMKQMELSFGDNNLNTAQFFNPEANKFKLPQKQKKREHSLPTTDFIALLSKPLQYIPQRRATFYHNNLKFKQKTLDSTQENMNLILKQINNKLQHSHSSCAVPKKYTSIPQQKENFECRESRTNSRCSVVSQGGDRKRKIKVNDPYGLFALRDNSQKTSAKSFINQKAQTKLVDKIFSQRSDSIQ